jgi:hypothetical protein
MKRDQVVFMSLCLWLDFDAMRMNERTDTNESIRFLCCYSRSLSFLWCLWLVRGWHEVLFSRLNSRSMICYSGGVGSRDKSKYHGIIDRLVCGHPHLPT